MTVTLSLPFSRNSNSVNSMKKNHIIWLPPNKLVFSRYYRRSSLTKTGLIDDTVKGIVKEGYKHGNQIPCLYLMFFNYYFVASALISRNFLTHSSPPKSL